MRRAVRSILLLALLLVSARAGAQRGVDAAEFHPALDGFGILGVERAETVHRWQFGFQLWANYADSPLSLNLFDSASGGRRRQVMLARQTGVDFGAWLGLTDWLEAAFDVPISAQSYTAAYGSFGSAADPLFARSGFYLVDRYTNVPPPDAGPLDFRLGLKARLLGAGPFHLALAAIVTFPFGDETAFTGDSSFTGRPVVIGDVTLGRLALAVNVGAVLRQETVVLDPHDVATHLARPTVVLDVGHELTYSAGARFVVTRWLGIAATLGGSAPMVGTPRDNLLELLGGLQLHPDREISIDLGAGGGLLTGAARRDTWRVFLGLSWTLFHAGQMVSIGGADSDGDGIPDVVDVCPREAEDKDGFDDEDGCPDLDNDNDGVPDARDKCPNDPEDRDGFQDDDGCPEVDNDGDGIPDIHDKCPNDPEDRDGFQDEDGCPDLDNDGDGIPDAVDRCPNEPETFNDIDDKDGCPDSGGVAAAPTARIDLSDVQVLFESGKGYPTRPSAAALDKVADRLLANRGVKRLRLEGHADGVEAKGKRAQQLSQARAEAVRNYLIGRGVEPTRLQAVGYGDSRPFDKRNSDEARARNRRVELIIVE